MKLTQPSEGRVRKNLRQSALTIATVGGVLIGVILGLSLRTREEPWSNREKMYLGFPGNLFLRMLQCMILPLIIPSLIVAVGNLDLRLSRRLGLQAILYYITTTTIAVFLGIILCQYIIKPGKG